MAGENIFEEATILAAARAKAGLEAFGDESFREPLGVLLRSLRDEANLNEIGRATQHARLVDSLVTRLLAEDAFRRHPEILDEDLGEPVVIVGLMRTGSTMLQRLLGSGPAFQTAKWWEVRYPAPFPGSDWKNDDPRIPAARAEVAATLAAVPVLATVHPWDAEAADEEIMLVEHSFLSWVPESSANLPAYGRWLLEQDVRPAYHYLERMLRFLQWQKKRSGRRTGRWLLKSPFHLAHIDALFESFPGARVIQTHRDPIDTIPSSASMYRSLWELATDDVDAKLVGAQVRDRMSFALTRCMRSRERFPAERFFDADYRDTLRDPFAQAERVYEWLSLPMTDEAARAMRAWVEANGRDKRPPHAYSLAEFGYSEEGLAAEFAEYRSLHLSA